MPNPQATLPVDVGGEVIDVPVCWTPERAEQYLKDAWDGGPVVLATMEAPEYVSRGGATEAETAYFRAVARARATKYPGNVAHPLFAFIASRAGAQAAHVALAEQPAGHPYRQVRT